LRSEAYYAFGNIIHKSKVKVKRKKEKKEFSPSTTPSTSLRAKGKFRIKGDSGISHPLRERQSTEFENSFKNSVYQC